MKTRRRALRALLVLILLAALASVAPLGAEEEEKGPYKGPAGEVPSDERDPPEPTPPPRGDWDGYVPPEDLKPGEVPLEPLDPELVIIIADIDGDGDDEVIFALPPIPDPFYVAAWDEDGDGDVDIILIY